MSNTLLALKASSEANDAEQRKLQEKRRNLLILIHDFLTNNGYTDSANSLHVEASAQLSKYCIADNVDLGLILDEYETYFALKYNRPPKITRKLRSDEIEQQTASKGSKTNLNNKKITSNKDSNASQTNNKLPQIHSSNANGVESSGTQDKSSPSFELQGSTIQPSSSDAKNAKLKNEEESITERYATVL